MEVGATVVGGGGTAVFIDLVFAEELVPVVKVHIGKREGGEEVGRKKLSEKRGLLGRLPLYNFFVNILITTS